MKKLIALFVLIPSFLFAGQNPYGLLELESYSNSDSTGVSAKRAKNDFSIKEAIASGNDIFFIKGYGYNGSAFPTSPAISVEYQASENWTTTANGTKMVFKTTAIGTTTINTSMTVSSTGLTLLSDAAPRTNLTPLAAGTLVWNSADGQLCVSTSTAVNSWVQVADGTTACSH